MKRTLITLLILVSCINLLYGQSYKSRSNASNWFVTGGIGTGTRTISTNYGFYFVTPKNLVISGKYNFISDIYLWGITEESESSISILVGISDDPYEPQLLLLIGSGMIQVERDNFTHGFIEKRSYGLLELNIHYVLSKADHIGFSLYGVANLNLLHPFAGISLNINIGSLRD